MGKPFWEIYLFNNPHMVEVYVDLAKRFDFDLWIEGQELIFADGKINELKKDIIKNNNRCEVTYLYNTKFGKLEKKVFFSEKEPRGG
ncbi:MAG: hypothetical protein HQ569_08680 [Actinobacteria bacterium]|nr:hypothetical protein [Actinomycetota bacterium]